MPVLINLNTSKDNVTTTEATIEYSCTVTAPPPEYTEEATIYYHIDSINSYAWLFPSESSTDASGTITWSGLPPGTASTFEASVAVKVTITRTVQTKQERTSYTYNTTFNDSSRLDVYTHPGSFNFGATTDEIIYNTITASKIHAFGAHIGKYDSWYNQEDQYTPSRYNYIKTGDVITAAFFNTMANDAHTSLHVEGYSTSPSDLSKHTLITANLWNQLATVVSSFN